MRWLIDKHNNMKLMNEILLFEEIYCIFKIADHVVNIRNDGETKSFDTINWGSISEYDAKNYYFFPLWRE